MQVIFFNNLHLLLFGCSHVMCNSNQSTHEDSFTFCPSLPSWNWLSLFTKMFSLKTPNDYLPNSTSNGIYFETCLRKLSVVVEFSIVDRFPSRPFREVSSATNDPSGSRLGLYWSDMEGFTLSIVSIPNYWYWCCHSLYNKAAIPPSPASHSRMLCLNWSNREGPTISILKRNCSRWQLENLCRQFGSMFMTEASNCGGKLNCSTEGPEEKGALQYSTQCSSPVLHCLLFWPIRWNVVQEKGRKCLN